MKTVFYTNLEQKLVSDWQKLWEKSSAANYINSPHWFMSVVATFGYRRYVIIALYKKEQLVAVAGMVEKKKFGIPVYTVAPEEYVCGMPFLLSMQDTTAVHVLVKAVVSLGNVFLDNVPEDFVHVLQSHITHLATTVQARNLYFPLQKNASGSVIIKKRSRLVSRIKGIEDKFSMEFFDGTTQKGLDVVFASDTKSSKQQKGYSAFADEKIRTFYRNLSAHFRKHFSVAILYFESEPIAYYIGFLVNNTYYWSQNAYVASYGLYSPGKVLLVKLIDLMGEKGIRTIDFGSGDYPMKRLLTDESRLLYQLVMARNTFIRVYLQIMTALQNNSYHFLYRNKPLYAFYRKVKTSFS